MNSCFIKYDAPFEENVIVAEEVIALSKKLLHFRVLEIRFVSIAVYDDVPLMHFLIFFLLPL